MSDLKTRNTQFELADKRIKELAQINVGFLEEVLRANWNMDDHISNLQEKQDFLFSIQKWVHKRTVPDGFCQTSACILGNYVIHKINEGDARFYTAINGVVFNDEASDREYQDSDILKQLGNVKEPVSDLFIYPIRWTYFWDKQVFAMRDFLSASLIEKILYCSRFELFAKIIGRLKENPTLWTFEEYLPDYNDLLLDSSTLPGIVTLHSDILAETLPYLSKTLSGDQYDKLHFLTEKFFADFYFRLHKWVTFGDMSSTLKF